MSVPAPYHGLWRRTGIWRSDGSCDLSTQALWFQAPRFHIDLRVPLDRAAPTGFAGVTVVDGARCEWQPEIAFPSLSTQLDAGSMRFDAADRLHERGLDGSYAEDWVRIAAGPVQSLRRQCEDGQVMFVIASDQWLALAGRAVYAFARREPLGWRVALCNERTREGSLLPDLGLDALLRTPIEKDIWELRANLGVDMTFTFGATMPCLDHQVQNCPAYAELSDGEHCTQQGCTQVKGGHSPAQTLDLEISDDLSDNVIPGKTGGREGTI